MAHSDDDGLVMPPGIASSHVVLMPIAKKPEDRGPVMDFPNALAGELRALGYGHRNVMVEVDDRDVGARGWDWIKKGIPLRVEIGPRDIAQNAVFVGRRDRSPRDKQSIPRDAFVKKVVPMLDEIQKNLFDRALQFRQAHTVQVDSKDDFYAFFTPKDSEKPEIHGGFALTHWCGHQRCEAKIKEDLSVTIRCIPFGDEAESGACIMCGGKSSQRVVFAKAY